MGLFDKFVSKQVEKHMDMTLNHTEELTKLDRSDPDAVRALAEKQRAESLAAMPEWMQKNWSKMQDMIPEAQKERMEKVSNQIIEKQAEFYRKINDK